MTALFTPERLAGRPALRRARDVLVRANGSYLDNMMKKGPTWKILRQLLTSENEITHEALDAVGRPGTGMLRSFLVATGVLQERNERFHAFERWIMQTAQTIADDADRSLFIGFARWRHLRKARDRDRTEAQFAGQRRELAQVRALLHLLHARGLTVRSVEQTTLDTWLTGGPAERQRVKSFLHWCRANGAGRALNVPCPPASPSQPSFSFPSKNAQSSWVGSWILSRTSNRACAWRRG
ncbi:hypothetical protein ACW0JT_19290 [Arthrobacter sp. SA17]